MGYALERLIKTDKQRNIIMFLGVIGLALTLLRFILFGTSSADLFTESPIYLFYIVGIYLFLGRVCIIKNDKIKKVISFLAKHSYSMYLMHVFPLEVLKTNNPILNLYPNINAYILYVIIIVIVFFTSLIGAIIMDNLLLKPLKRFLNCKLLA